MCGRPDHPKAEPILLSQFLQYEGAPLRLVLSMVSYYFIVTAFTTMLLITAEWYPTTGRALGIGFAIVATVLGLTGMRPHERWLCKISVIVNTARLCIFLCFVS